MYVLLLRVKQVNQESLEEMGCLAKKEYLDYQENRCVCVCVFLCLWLPSADCMDVVYAVLFLSSPPLCHHGVICSSGHCWASRPVGLEGGAGRQRCSREGENMLYLLSSLCLRGQTIKLVCGCFY